MDGDQDILLGGAAAGASAVVGAEALRRRANAVAKVKDLRERGRLLAQGEYNNPGFKTGFPPGVTQPQKGPAPAANFVAANNIATTPNPPSPNFVPGKEPVNAYNPGATSSARFVPTDNVGKTPNPPKANYVPETNVAAEKPNVSITAKGNPPTANYVPENNMAAQAAKMTPPASTVKAPIETATGVYPAKPTVVRSLLGKAAGFVGKVAPYAAGALTVYDVANRSMTKGAEANEIARDDMASNLASRGMGGFEVNNVTDEQFGRPEDPRVSARQTMAELKSKRQNAVEEMRESRGSNPYDRLVRTGVKGDTSNFAPSAAAMTHAPVGKPGDTREEPTAPARTPEQRKASLEAAQKMAEATPVDQRYEAAKQGNRIVDTQNAFGGGDNTKFIDNAAPGQGYQGTVATGGSKAAGFMPVDSIGSTPSVIGSRTDPKTGKSVAWLSGEQGDDRTVGPTTQIMGPKPQATGGSSGIPSYETKYVVRGNNGGTGEMTITGPSQRKGGGTVSVMDQGNGGTIEGNVAAMERQYQALRAQREAMNPGITTGTGRFAPREEAPSTDPFGGDSERRAKYESLINEAANEKGWGASKRAARKMAAAAAMINLGSEEAKLRMGLFGKQLDAAADKERTAAQRLQAQVDAESAAAQRQQAQYNADRNYGLQADNQQFQQDKDAAQFIYNLGKDAKARGDSAYKEVQADAQKFYEDSGDKKGNGRVNPADLLVFGEQMFKSKDAADIEAKYPGLTARIANKTPRYADYHLLKAMRDSYNGTEGWFKSPSMDEATNRYLSMQDK